MLKICIVTFLSELMETTSEDHKSMETDNTELEPMKTVGDNFVDKPSTTCSNQGRLQTTEKSGSGTEAGSENSKKFSDENVKSNQKLLNRTQSQNCVAQSAVFQNAPGLSISRNGAQTRAPFRQLNCNSKQTIWRPWWEKSFTLLHYKQSVFSLKDAENNDRHTYALVQKLSITRKILAQLEKKSSWHTGEGGKGDFCVLAWRFARFTFDLR